MAATRGGLVTRVDRAHLRPPPPAAGRAWFFPEWLPHAHESLADTFQGVVDSLPDDWTDIEFDLRPGRDESRYIDAATYLVTVNALPYSRHDWHWRVLVAHRFGHAGPPPRPSTGP